MSNLTDESAVSVTTMVISLNDPFHLDGFNEKRQGLLTALVACSPKNVAPCDTPLESEDAVLNEALAFWLSNTSTITSPYTRNSSFLQPLPWALEN